MPDARMIELIGTRQISAKSEASEPRAGERKCSTMPADPKEWAPVTTLEGTTA
jgi:hypothetical protein